MRVTQAFLVDERVRGDRDPDREADSDAFRPAVQAAHEHDAEADEADGKRLCSRNVAAEDDRRAEQDEDGCRAARDRIDDGELSPTVRGDEQEEIRGLERRRCRDVRPR